MQQAERFTQQQQQQRATRIYWSALLIVRSRGQRRKGQSRLSCARAEERPGRMRHTTTTTNYRSFHNIRKRNPGPHKAFTTTTTTTNYPHLLVRATDRAFAWPESQGPVSTVSCMGRGAAGTHASWQMVLLHVCKGFGEETASTNWKPPGVFSHCASLATA